MIITSPEELRFHSPAHALDTLDGMAGFIINAEHETLIDKLGEPLYAALADWYDDNRDVVLGAILSATTPGSYWGRLCIIAQRVVAFDALGRSVGIQQLSVHNSGVNVPVASDYAKPSKENIDTYAATARKECHTSVNHMLTTLEQWCRAIGSATDESAVDPDMKRITELWRESRYYYLAAGMLIPSAAVLQSYRNIWENRERFILMLPDLRFIQEEQMATAFGDTFVRALSDYALTGKAPETAEGETVSADALDNALHALRKVEAALLVERTTVLSTPKEQRVQAHDDAVRLMDSATAWLRANSASFPDSMAADAPWRETAAATESVPAAIPEPDPASSVPCGSAAGMTSRPESACWTPPLL